MGIGSVVLSTAGQNSANFERYCYKDAATCTGDASLYTWDEAMQGSSAPPVGVTVQGICPVGFHIPTDDEWYSLENYLRTGANTCSNSRTSGDCSAAGTTLKTSSATTFSGILAGKFDSQASPAPVFQDGPDKPVASQKAHFWSSGNDSGSSYWFRGLDSSDQVIRNSTHKNDALSVRCIEDH